MASLQELKQERLQKLQKLKEMGFASHKPTSNQTITNKDFLDDFPNLEQSGDQQWLTGRIMAKRGHGQLLFIDIFDGTETVQVYAKSDNIPGDKFRALSELTDRGDFVDVFGVATTTKRGEPSIAIIDWDLATKSLAPLPDSWAGLQDPDLRYRNRHLDLLMNDELRNILIKKARFWQSAREFMVQEGFVEVRTPTLEVTTGGAEASPFVTHHNDFDIDVHLRISVGELWQKRLMAAGFFRTFEMGRIYRNEGSSPEHLQEFDNLEFYAANMDFDTGLDLLERHFAYVIDQTFDGQREFRVRDFDINFTPPFKRIDYVTTVEEKTGVNVLDADETEMKAALERLQVTYEGDNRERLTDTLWKYCRKTIGGPVWLVGHPKLVSPLAKADPDDPRKTLRAQLILGGSELNNCFSELNDPIDQRQRFELQKNLLENGDDEAMMPDWEFVEMLEHGMPPTFGASGVGERLFAFLVNLPIRETQLFPLVKPKKE